MLHLLRTKIQTLTLTRNLHFKPLNSDHRSFRRPVAILWDLESRTTRRIPAFDAAARLKRTATSLGYVSHLLAYATKPAPPEFADPGATSGNHRCGVCGRRFRLREKYVEHFRAIHAPEYAKKVERIESAVGSWRARLVGRYAMKMERFERSVAGVLVPRRPGYGEIERVGFRIESPEFCAEKVSDLIGNDLIGCVLVVSEEEGLEEGTVVGRVVREAKRRRVKVVLVGNGGDEGLRRELKRRRVRTAVVARESGCGGACGLRRAVDGAFHWREVICGKAVGAAVKMAEKWRDRHVLERFEWSYNPTVEIKSVST